MKIAIFFLTLLITTTDCFAQNWYQYEGTFSSVMCPYFHIPIGKSLKLKDTFSWGGGSHIPGDPPPLISPSFKYDSSYMTISILSPDYGINGSENLNIILKSDTARCLNPPSDAILAFYYGYYGETENFENYNNTYYYLQGVFYDTNIIGRLLSPDSVDFGSIPTDSLLTKTFYITNDSLGQYRAVKRLSVHTPFGMDSSIEMSYYCNFYHNPGTNCYFHPTAPGHYVDTAKLLDPLTNDTISVVLIGDAYDAGVSEALEPQVKLYPNPCDRELNIEMPADEPSEIEIRNMLGVVVYSSPVATSTSVDFSQFPRGIYFVCFKNSNLVDYRKILVTR